MIIGFGSTETEREEKEQEEILEAVRRMYGEREDDYFSDLFVGKVREWVEQRAKELRAVDASYKNAEDYPSRYGYYHATVAADASHIFVYLRWMHTNRRHGFSPDGWACLQTRQVFVIDKYDDLERGP